MLEINNAEAAETEWSNTFRRKWSDKVIDATIYFGTSWGWFLSEPIGEDQVESRDGLKTPQGAMSSLANVAQSREFYAVGRWTECE